MDPSVVGATSKLLTYGPLGIFAALSVAALVVLWRKNEATRDKCAQEKDAVIDKYHALAADVKDVLSSALARLQK